MPKIGTSGSMSGDGKRSVAAWLKLPRPSSTLPTETWTAQEFRSAKAREGSHGRPLPSIWRRPATASQVTTCWRPRWRTGMALSIQASTRFNNVRATRVLACQQYFA